VPAPHRHSAWIPFWLLAAAAFAILALDIADTFPVERRAAVSMAELLLLTAAGAALIHALRLSRAATAAQITAERDMLVDLMQSVPDGIALWDGDGKLRAFNETFERKHRFPDGKRLGLAYRDFIANALAKELVESESGDATAHLAGRVAAFAAADGAPHEITKSDGEIEEVRFYRARGGGVVSVYRDVTELKRRATEIETQRADFSEILETLPDGLMLWDENGRLTAFNQAAMRLRAGFQPTLIGIRFEDFARAGVWSGNILYAQGREEEAFAALLAEHADPKGAPREVARADGRWDEIRKFKTKNGGVVSIYRDITDRKRAETELERERGRSADILAAIHDGIVLWGADNRLAALNPSAARMPSIGGIAELGIDFAEFARRSLIKDPIVQAVGRPPPDLADRLANHANPTGEPQEFQYRDGKWLEVRKFRARDGGVVAVFRDVTERKRGEAELQRQRRLLQEIMDALPDGLQLWSADGKLAAFNRKAAEQRASAVPLTLGIDYADFIRRSAYSGSIPEFAGNEEAHIAMRLADHANPEAQARNVLRADGRWEEVRKVATSDGGRLGLFRDITAEKRALAERDSAEAASRAKTEFLAMMSHELRTPMNGVIATTGLLARTRLGDEQRLFLDTIQRSAQSLLTIIDDVLDWAKLEEGRIEIEAIDCAPAQIADNVVSLLRPAAAQKGIALELEFDPALPEFGLIDPARLRQILLNLVGNAVKFTAQGGVTVRLAAEPTPGGRMLSLEVADTGIGIASDALPRLFERFTQADGSIARRYGGTGLDLAIVKRLLDLMGGSINVRSRPGAGSRFLVRLPMPDGRRPVSTAAPLLPAPTRALKLLVAEDNAINRMVVEHLLRELGHSAEFVHDGAEAVTKARDGDYDAILMDVQMPDVDGIQATRLIRALDGARAHVPIVALTANAMAGDRERYLEAGMDDYVSKPIDAYALAAALARIDGAPAPESRATGAPRLRQASEPHAAGKAALAELVEALKRSGTNSG
jgi:signal transduction histidine kinase/CheY-like chemotaxis protein